MKRSISTNYLQQQRQDQIWQKSPIKQRIQNKPSSVAEHISQFSHNRNKTNINKSTVGSQKSSIIICVRIRPIIKSFETDELWEINTNSSNGKPQIVSKQDKIRADMQKQIEIQQLQQMQQKQSNKEKIDLSVIKRRYADIYSQYSFQYGQIFSQESTTEEIYTQQCQPLVQRFLEGFNVTIFMYGQTTSGKTYTMLGDLQSPGILPFSLHDIFLGIDKKKQNLNISNIKIKVSYLEIYNEQINDLLNPNSENLKLIDQKDDNIQIQGLKVCNISTLNEAILLMKQGEQNRSYKEKNHHDHSSRSHTIFRIELLVEQEMQKGLQTAQQFKSVINLVDLAGSERLNDDDIEINKTNEETGFINKSLFVLSDVIQKLAQQQQQQQNKAYNSKNNHIPFRNSKLTRLLQNSLSGNSLTCMICCVSPASQSFYQTLSTLRFAQRAQILQTHLNKNTNTILRTDKQIINQQQQKIDQYLETMQNQKQIIEQLTNQNQQLQQENQQLQQENQQLLNNQQTIQHQNQNIINLSEKHDFEQQFQHVRYEISKYLINIDKFNSQDQLNLNSFIQKYIDNYTQEIQHLTQNIKLQFISEINNIYQNNTFQQIVHNILFQNYQSSYIQEQQSENNFQIQNQREQQDSLEDIEVQNIVQNINQQQIFSDIIIPEILNFENIDNFISQNNQNYQQFIQELNNSYNEILTNLNLKYIKNFEILTNFKQKQQLPKEQELIQLILDQLNIQFKELQSQIQSYFMETINKINNYQQQPVQHNQSRQIIRNSINSSKVFQEKNTQYLVWGSGKDGRLGVQKQIFDQQSPYPIKDQDQWPEFSYLNCGYYHSTGITENGQIFTWGKGNLGQLGHGDYDNQQLPKQVIGLNNARCLRTPF